MLSTGGTARALREAGARVTEVAAYTGAPEILDGRVKTLHPKIHGGLLGRATPEHRGGDGEARHRADRSRGREPLSRSARRSRAPTSRFAEAIENIDIGGPSMIRSAAKNHERVTVVVDPDDYAAVHRGARRQRGADLGGAALPLARKAFAYTAAYDGAIANWLTSLDDRRAAAATRGGERRRWCSSRSPRC